MSQFQTKGGTLVTRKSGADLTGKEGYAVKLSSGLVVLASAATDKILGTLVNGGQASGDNVVVHVGGSGGTFKVKTGGAVTVDAYVTATTDGTLVATTSSGNVVIGRALEGADSGDVIECMSIYLIYP